MSVSRVIRICRFGFGRSFCIFWKMKKHYVYNTFIHFWTPSGPPEKRKNMQKNSVFSHLGIIFWCRNWFFIIVIMESTSFIVYYAISRFSKHGFQSLFCNDFDMFWCNLHFVSLTICKFQIIFNEFFIDICSVWRILNKKNARFCKESITSTSDVALARATTTFFVFFYPIEKTHVEFFRDTIQRDLQFFRVRTAIVK